jgi:hypothetical protein
MVWCGVVMQGLGAHTCVCAQELCQTWDYADISQWTMSSKDTWAIFVGDLFKPQCFTCHSPWVRVTHDIVGENHEVTLRTTHSRVRTTGGRDQDVVPHLRRTGHERERRSQQQQQQQQLNFLCVSLSPSSTFKKQHSVSPQRSPVCSWWAPI